MRTGLQDGTNTLIHASTRLQKPKAKENLESLLNHGLTIILVSSLSSRIIGLTYDYAVCMSGAGSDLLAGSLAPWAH